MNEQHPTTEWLERRLADPPVLPDHGFSAVVEARIVQVERLRRLVFGGSVLAWLVLVAVVWPLSSLGDSLDRLLSLGERISGLIPAQFDDRLIGLGSDPAYVVAVLLLMAACLVLTTLQIEDW